LDIHDYLTLYRRSLNAGRPAYGPIAAPACVEVGLSTTIEVKKYQNTISGISDRRKGTVMVAFDWQTVNSR